MTRIEANQIALGIMREHLNLSWYSCATTNKLTMRGVQMRNAIATKLLQASRGASRRKPT